jgi:hypothetical protein
MTPKARPTCPVGIGFIDTAKAKQLTGEPREQVVMAISRSRKALNKLLLRAELGENQQRPVTKNS